MSALSSEQSCFLLLLPLGFLGAALAPRLSRYLPKLSGLLFAAIPLAHFLFLLKLTPDIMGGKNFNVALPWIAAQNIALSFRIDSLSLLFALLVSGIGVLIVLYGAAYFKDDPKLGKFYGLILCFFTAMQGLVTSDSMLLMFIFWELTSISSYLLIGFKNEEEGARKSALQALMITGAGGLCLLVGVIALQHLGGSWNFSEIPTDLFSRQPSWFLPCLLLISAGAFTKSAQFPFHFWLPQAMAAPTPVSAYLHSATMVKAGIYLLLRLQPVLGGNLTWFYLLSIIGALTTVLGALMALGQRDLKRLLAYTTVSGLGMLVMLIGLGLNSIALLFLVVHCLYKASAFMMTGSIDHATGTRDLERLGGLFRKLPWTGLAALLAAGSMAGLPPFLGFLAKEYIYENILHLGSFGIFMLILAFIANAATVTAALMMSYEVFVGPAKTNHHLPEHVHDSFSLAFAPLFLAILGLLSALFPQSLSALLTSSSRYFSQSPELSFALWHGFNKILMLSGVTLLSGLLIFIGRQKFRRSASNMEKNLHPLEPAALYDRMMNSILSLASAQTRLLNHGYLRHYIATIFTFALITVGLGGIHYFRGEIFSGAFEQFSSLYPILLIFVIMAVASILRNESRLNSLIKLGFIGLGITLIFTLYGAPDLALTQVMIEVLTVILFVLVVYRLPKIRRLSSRTVRIRDGILALSMGTMMFLMTLQAQKESLFPSIQTYFGENSYVRAFGRNVVNVILIDFRGFDTMGEISVLAMTAIGLVVLLSKSRKDDAS